MSDNLAYHYHQGAERERSRIIAMIDDMLRQVTPIHASPLRHLRRELITPDNGNDDLDDLRAGVEIARQAAERDW